MKTTNLIFCIILILYGINTFSQVSINTDGSDPDNSAMLDVKSTTRGVLIPRMTTAERDAISSPSNGLMIYNTSINKFNYYNGSGWDIIGAAGIDGDWNISGNNIYSAVSGNVGIGTSLPTRKLHVVETGVSAVADFQRTSCATATIVGGLANTFFGSRSNHPVAFGSKNSEHIWIDTNGIVGIGTTSPVEQLDVNGGIRVGSSTNNNAGSIRWSGTQMEYNDGSVWSPIGDSCLWTQSGDSIYNVKTGNIGIGTTSPVEQLDVNGGIRVGSSTNNNAGTIRWSGTQMEYNDGAAWKTFGDSCLWWQSGGNIYNLNTGRVGIGTTFPQYDLHLEGYDPTMTITNHYHTMERSTKFYFDPYGFCIQNESSLDYNIYLCPGSLPTMVLKKDGVVGINTIWPTANLSVYGSANKIGGGMWSVLSDARSKENVVKYSKGLSELLQLRPVSFNYKEKFEWGNDTYVGLIAQEVEKVIPEMVTEIEISGINDFREIDPNDIIYMLINAVKEQQKQIDELNMQMMKLKGN
jgi:hypothetical protein